MSEEAQKAEDIRWLEGEANAEEAVAVRLLQIYPRSASTRRAIESYETTAARYRRILSYINGGSAPHG